MHSEPDTSAHCLAHILVEVIRQVLDGTAAPSVLVEALEYGDEMLARLDAEILAGVAA